MCGIRLEERCVGLDWRRVVWDLSRGELCKIRLEESCVRLD